MSTDGQIAGCCWHGHPVMGSGRCPQCEASVQQACDEFEADVAAGRCGPRGHTLKELAAMEKQKRTAA